MADIEVVSSDAGRPTCADYESLAVFNKVQYGTSQVLLELTIDVSEVEGFRNPYKYYTLNSI